MGLALEPQHWEAETEAIAGFQKNQIEIDPSAPQERERTIFSQSGALIRLWCEGLKIKGPRPEVDRPGSGQLLFHLGGFNTGLPLMHATTELAKIEIAATAYADQNMSTSPLFLVVHVFNATEIIQAGELTEIVSGVVVVSNGRVSLEPVAS